MTAGSTESWQKHVPLPPVVEEIPEGEEAGLFLPVPTAASRQVNLILGTRVVPGVSARGAKITSISFLPLGVVHGLTKSSSYRRSPNRLIKSAWGWRQRLRETVLKRFRFRGIIRLGSASQKVAFELGTEQ